jgi:predicted nucleic acid-binding protein
MIAICNASPLINLAWLGRLDLLHQLYTATIIPEAVRQEVLVAGQGKPGAAEVAAADWLTFASAQNRTLLRALSQDLDLGEAEVIALALEHPADIVIMDERLGRQTAAYFGLRCIGTIGILVAAKRQGFIPAIRPDLERLKYQQGYYISERLYDRVLADAGE